MEMWNMIGPIKTYLQKKTLHFFEETELCFILLVSSIKKLTQFTLVYGPTTLQ